MILFAVLIMLALIVTGWVYAGKVSQQKKVAKIKAGWGKPNSKTYNYKLTAAYFEQRPGKKNISAQSAKDMDLDNVFAYINHTLSKPGEQYLYHKLHSQHSTFDELIKLESRINELTGDEEKRDLIRLKLSKLNGADAYYLPELFSKSHRSLFPWFTEFYIKVSAIVIVILAVLLAIRPNQFFLLTIAAMVLANAVIHFINKARVLKYTHSLPQLLTLYDVAKWLSTNTGNKGGIAESLSALAKLKRSLSMVNLQNAATRDPTDLAYLIMEWLNMFLLIEPLIFIYSINKVNQYLDEIRHVYQFVAEIDVAISIKSLRVSLPYSCIPNFAKDDNTFSITDLYHPLVPGCVANSITGNCAQGILVTGSNMSGKTTFIRAIAINALLAQSINTCCCKSYRAPFLNIFTSIQINDDINAQKSFFQAEALSVLDIINQCAENKPVKSLVIIDEIFRGTNTIERVAAAKAVLSFLTADQNFVFVSTHDLELAALLGDEYAVYSFTELREDNRLIFDYKLKSGLLKTRNGIAVLQSLGYPQEIVDDANNVSKQLTEKYRL